MRPGLSLALTVLTACGPVKLGDEPAEDGFDADHTIDPQLDGGVTATVTIQVQEDCSSCANLSANAAEGRAPYRFEWSDGARGPQRSVCSGSSEVLSVVAVDALGMRSEPQAIRVELPDASCGADASVPLLQIENGSFEGMPAYNSGVPVAFDGAPWDDCAQPPRTAPNTPEIGNASISQIVVRDVPAATDGSTFLGLMEDEQVSQALGEPLYAGDARSFRVDARELDITGGVVPDTESTFIEVWGGTAANCTPRELLWASPLLAQEWQTFCITIKPREYMDFLTLRARSNMVLASTTYSILDSLVPVARCP
jgi:hypothetical protein